MGVSPACPPLVTVRSVSFRLRFRFVRVVRAVRAGEAKLRGRMYTVILIAGLPLRTSIHVCLVVFLLISCAQAHKI